MEIALNYLTPAGPCGYLPEQTWQLEYDLVAALTPAEYMERLQAGWRRFGHALFRPRCPACSACRSLRIPVDRFRPDRSQRRAGRLNDGVVRVEVGVPSVSPAKLDLYDRFHAYQSEAKGWPEHGPKDAAGYVHSFVANPFPTQEWRYFLGDRLVGVGYVDALPGGLSAIYFFYDPLERARSLGTWNVLLLIEHAAARGLPHLYLGYYVVGCRSMEYKARFRPNELLQPDGRWHERGG
jgi:arginine-tRNA-protein transferase